ncbi:MAG: CpaF family protein [Chloroflexi bacterium]|nr:MAG: CpaF family protein [Chloroflexota bacterium]TME56383.1 MAG: CpaF family protein [Chloroflexota bacterium]
MGLLDRVKQNQTGVPVSAPPASNGPAATSSGTPYAAATAIPVARQAAPVEAAIPIATNLAARAAIAAGGEMTPAFTAAKVQIHAKLIEKFADQIDSSNKGGVREKIVELAEEYFRSTAMTMTKADKERLIESVLDDVLGLGPLEALLADPSITEIMANHPKQIYVEKSGEPTLSAVTFESERQMRQVIDRIVSLVGRRVDESTPICDARLKDGSRVNVVIPPIALKGPCLTIRKFAKEKWGPADVVNRFRSSSPELMTFLRSCVRARLNILVSGGTGSGKTTLLNILSSFIPETERLITCEDAAELQLQQPHWIQLESRPPNVEGKGAVPIRELVKSCLRMRPDRIIVGECRGGEALDMLQAMNTGHDGSMSTLHANNPHECLVRLETLVLQAGQDLPSRAIRETIGAAIHLIVQQSRLRGGVRRIVSVAEVLGMKDGEVQFQELFTFRQIGVNSEGKAVGYHTATGVIPMRMEHLKSEGEDVPESLFVPTPQPPPDKLY